MKTFVQILIMLFVSTPLLANISGKVIDENHNPIPGVNIYIKDTYEGTTTDSLGYFEINTELNGKHTLIASFVGCNSFQKEIDINGNNTGLIIILIQNNRDLGTVEIIAGAFVAGDKSKSVVLKPLDLAITAGAEGDIFGTIATLPGSQKVGEEGMLFVRGGESYETKTFMDGMLVQQPYYSSMPNLPSRGRFSPLLFSGTVFSTGAYSAEFGQALSSAILLNTTALAPKNQSNIMLLSAGGGASHTRRWDKSSLSANIEYQNLSPYFAITKQNIDWLKAPENMGGSMVFRHKTRESGLIKSFASVNHNKSSLLYPSPDNNINDTIALTNSNIYLNTTFNEMLSEKWMLKTGVAYNYDNENTEFNSDFLVDEYQQCITLSNSDRYNVRLQNYKHAGFAETEFKLSKKFAALISVHP